MPKVYNKRHKDVPTDAVYIGRPSKWGNPWSHLPHGSAIYKVDTREQAVEAFKGLIDDAYKREAQKELRGKDLVCWCAPLACHGDILLEIANEN